MTTSGEQLSAADAAVLVVDDDQRKRMAIRAIVESSGYTVLEAESGLEALRHLLRQDFAAILMDIRMPVMDGYETTRLIRERQHCDATPIILVTNYQRLEIDTDDGYASGAVDFIFAPVVASVLRSKLAVFGDLFLKTRALETDLLSAQEQLESAKNDITDLRRLHVEELNALRPSESATK